MVCLPHGTLDVPTLGFGCAYLVAGFNERFARRVVSAAMEAGYRHFDVAPSYGLGSAESVLGEALRGRRHEVTITSKAGERWVSPSRTRLILHSAAMPVRARLRGLRRRMAVGARDAVPPRNKPLRSFAPDAVRQSLEESLRRLGTDYLDIFLLHEVELVDLTDELLRMLDVARQEGKIRAIGIGSERPRVERIAAAYQNAFDVYQYGWDAFDRRAPLIASDRFTVLHRAVLYAAEELSAWRRADPERLARASAAVGIDLADEGELARVLVGASMTANPGGLTLIGSRSPARARAAAAPLRDLRYLRAGSALHGFLADEGLSR